MTFYGLVHPPQAFFATFKRYIFPKMTSGHCFPILFAHNSQKKKKKRVVVKNGIRDYINHHPIL